MGPAASREAMGEEIWAGLRRGAVVVTANERAARTLRRGYDELLRSEGDGRWESAPVMSWSAWTVSMWRRMVLDGRARSMLLNPFQEHAVWRGVLAGDEDAGGLRGVDGLAKMAAESWARLCAYAEPVARRGPRTRGMAARLRDENGSRDTAAFSRWAARFEERCAAEQMLTMPELDGLLGEAVRGGQLRPEASEILLVGFDRLTPAQERLRAAMGGAGVSVSSLEVSAAPTRSLLSPAEDEAEELRACARWTAGWLHREPHAHIAVIVPDLAGERAGLERVFREVLAPEIESIEANEGDVPYEFSLGRPLADVPMVAIALELLRWAGGSLPLGRVSGLLVSAYFAGNGEGEARAEFDASELRQAGMLRPEISLTRMARMVAGSRRSEQLPGLLGALRRMERRSAEFDGIAQSFGLWTEGFRALLAEAGWGADRAETSPEFQARERWESALDAMSTLDFEDHAAEFGDALGALERIARETIFAPESRSAPVQILGPLEAAGSGFDAVWFLRAGEMSWPPGVASLPLLSWGLQREFRMPGTDTVRDLEAARLLTERILASGREVVVSYARRSGELHRQKASSIVRGMGLEEIAMAELAGAEPQRTPIPVERVEDSAAFRPLPDGPVQGGVRVLELQAACGFRAFAEQRLGSAELRERALGLDAKESGIAVHRALESFWAEVRSQAALIAMGGEEREEAIARAIGEGLAKARSMSQGAWDEVYVEVQRERLRRLLHRWLEMEIERPAFAVMEQEEEQRDVEVGPLRFRLRVDRVDLVDEAQVLIDYKTGAAAPKDWLGDRPDAPQVPLYAILAARSQVDAALAEQQGQEEFRLLEPAGTREAGPPELGAVAFASVRTGKHAKLNGFAVREGLLPGKLTRIEAGTFEAQVDRWREVLVRLAGEFAAGDARVRPKNYPGTCGRCGQRILCRLDATLLEEIEQEDGEDG